MLKSKKIIVMVLAVLCITALSITAIAAEKITDQACSLTVTFQKTKEGTDSDYAKEGVTVKLYKVCSITDLGEVEVTPDFKGLEIKTTDTSSEVLENAVKKLTSKTNVSSQTKTDADKKAEFKNIERGIYLVDVDPYENNSKEYGIKNALVMLPYETDENEWEYSYNLNIELKGYEILKQKYVVTVEWEDTDDSERPESVDVEFNRNGFNTETNISDPWSKDVMLTNESWNSSNITPETISGYTYKVTVDGQKIVITYTADEKPVPPTPPEKKNYDTVVINIPGEEEEIPNTGLLWWPISILAVAGIAFVAYGVIRRKHANEE